MRIVFSHELCTSKPENVHRYLLKKKFVRAHTPTPDLILCETYIDTPPPQVNMTSHFLPLIQKYLSKQDEQYTGIFKMKFGSVAVCHKGYLTMDFNGCDKDCFKGLYNNMLKDKINFAERCKDEKLFQCRDGLLSIPYTQVCDFSQQCADQSDEFCTFPECGHTQCTNKQCLGKTSLLIQNVQ